jgi:catechol-2,3-dioxygenase
LLFTGDFEQAESWLCQALGLRVSDRAAGKVSFLSGGTGVRDHHCFGLINSTHRGFQHSSFHVDSFDDIGFGSWQMRQAGFADQFGLGRHALASNLFLYVRDPWGSWLEYYTDMDKISEAWVARDWKELPYVWGPTWSPEFWANEMNANLEPR